MRLGSSRKATTYLARLSPEAEIEVISVAGELQASVDMGWVCVSNPHCSSLCSQVFGFGVALYS